MWVWTNSTPKILRGWELSLTYIFYLCLFCSQCQIYFFSNIQKHVYYFVFDISALCKIFYQTCQSAKQNVKLATWMFLYCELTWQTLPKCSIGHKFVNQHLFPLFKTESNKANKILVVDSWKQLNFSLELYASLHRSLLSSFDCNYFPIRENPFVHLKSIERNY